MIDMIQNEDISFTLISKSITYFIDRNTHDQLKEFKLNSYPCILIWGKKY